MVNGQKQSNTLVQITVDHPLSSSPAPSASIHQLCQLIKIDTDTHYAALQTHVVFRATRVALESSRVDFWLKLWWAGRTNIGVGRRYRRPPFINIDNACCAVCARSYILALLDIHLCVNECTSTATATATALSLRVCASFIASALLCACHSLLSTSLLCRSSKLQTVLFMRFCLLFAAVAHLSEFAFAYTLALHSPLYSLLSFSSRFFCSRISGLRRRK